MKILIISDLFPPDVIGGYELRCEEACKWLHKKGYQIEVLTTRSTSNIEDHPYPVHRLLYNYALGKTPSTWHYFKRLRLAIEDNLVFKKTLSRVKPDLIYIWNLTGISRTLIPLIFSSKTRKLVDVSSIWLLKVYTQHGPVFRPLENRHQLEFFNLFGALGRFLLPIISLNTIQPKYFLDFSKVSGYFTSDWNKRFQSETIKPCEDFQVIHTGIDIKKFPFREKDFDGSKISLLYIGRIQGAKGFLLLLNQLEYFVNHCSLPVTLSVIGRFDSQTKEDEIKDQIEKLGLKDFILFIGQIDRMKLSQYYHQADFTIFPSITTEAFSRIPLESMACGTPCLSTDNPGSKELFERDAPLIYLDRSAEGLLKSLEPFLTNKTRYKEISEAGWKFVEEAFTFDHFMQNVQKKFLQ